MNSRESRYTRQQQQIEALEVGARPLARQFAGVDVHVTPNLPPCEVRKRFGSCGCPRPRPKGCCRRNERLPRASKGNWRRVPWLQRGMVVDRSARCCAVCHPDCGGVVQEALRVSRSTQKDAHSMHHDLHAAQKALTEEKARCSALTQQLAAVKATDVRKTFMTCADVGCV